MAVHIVTTGLIGFFKHLTPTAQ